MEATTPVLCARCTESTPRGIACGQCGEDPRLDHRYWLLEQLGHGAFGTTFRAERESDGAELAVKELLVRRLQDFKAHDLFKREANMLRSLSHPAIPTYVDDFMAGEGRHVGLYLVVDLIDGRTLADELMVKRTDMRGALETVRELCDVLAYLHARTPPVVHRDLKPGNIMRKSDGSLALIDFGSVKDVVRQGEPGSTVAGTFGYMPPEQLAGRATPASDIYALGVILLELVTRQPPHDLLDEQNRLAWEHFIDDGPLKDLLSDMLQPEAARRLSDAKEVERRIDAILSGQANRATPAKAAGKGARGGGGFGVRDAHAVPGKMRDVMNMLRGAGIMVEPGRSDPPPEAPRALPERFGKRIDPVGHFFRIFGFAFGVPATLILASVFSSIPGGFLGFGLPFLVFPVLGIIFFTIGFLRISRAAKVFRAGEHAEAVVTDVNINTSLRVNGRSPYRISFRFSTGDGREHEATVSRFDVRPELRVPGAQVHAIYDPAKPEKALLWPM